ncbi:hypothetical protein CAK95_18855 [Pseudorhodoplanes sinuspersici]|uniref:Uncharacterized protein n=1 Tax=Pseudorhodoplanes sinuspersici TaxID=1235591 RepID=A0A1W6ZU15_9HYPH|nr:hypothetical protein CAK95_18855 [Pseudorhodoplanes sinuspersici]
MGIVIDFPVREAASVSRGETFLNHRAEVVILPVVRIERYDDHSAFIPPTRTGDTSRRRRRRAARS